MNLIRSGHKPTISSCSDHYPQLCLLCCNSSDSHICPTCQAQLDYRALRYRYQLTPQLQATALYPYVSPLRDLVLRVKIEGSLRARQAVLHLLNCHRHLPRAQVIVPAPSSLWSRLRGRHDLAWMIASNLARRSGAKLIEAPLFTQWRRHKQAKQRRSEFYQLPRLPQRMLKLLLPRVAGQTILLVDDVITSGATMCRLAALFPDNQVGAFAFCLSPGNNFTRRRP